MKLRKLSMSTSIRTQSLVEFNIETEYRLMLLPNLEGAG